MKPVSWGIAYAILTGMKRALAAVGGREFHRLNFLGLKRQKIGAKGYTIIELLIVLSVMGGLFASVAILLSGKQRVTEFTQAVRDYEAKIQSVASDVAAGNFRSGEFNCSAGSTGHVDFLPAPVSDAGTNKGCLFLGKVITTGSSDSDIFTVAGRQYMADNVTDVKTVADAIPWTVYSPVDITEAYAHKFGMMIKNVYTIPNNQSVGGFGFLLQLGGSGAGNPDTGSRGVLLYSVTGTSSPNANGRAANAGLINTTLTAASTGIRVCLWDGGSHKGEITIGENNSQTATEVTVDNGISTVCQNA
jgi:prepilin-type N-terminal cleavage/methylation domain-containing protein